MKKTAIQSSEIKTGTIFILDEETKFLSINIDEKKNKIVCSGNDLKNLLATPFHCKNIIILVELDWGNRLSKFRGYEVARELMNSPNRASKFNLLFISTLKRETIFEAYKNKQRIFTQKFKHIPITIGFDLSKLSVPEISVKKFDYLKNYCLLESGILDRMEHDIRNLIINTDDYRLQKTIEDIKANADILTPEIIDAAESLTNTSNIENRKKTLTGIHRLLQSLQDQINDPGEVLDRKSFAKVILIEDNTATLKKLQQQFSRYFSYIKVFNSGTEAFNELVKKGKEYDAVITDMELLHGNFDDEKQGIDILELCENSYPFIVTRVITSLPKNALKQLIGKGLGEIVFKSMSSDSVIPPFENLVEFVRQIDKEVQKRKVLRSMPGPEGSWWGKYLTKQLYLTKIEKPDEFDFIWKSAINLANRFIEGRLNDVVNTEKLSIEFKQVGETGSNPEAGWEIIERLLTHRLIALWFSTTHSWDEFYYSGDGGSAYVNLKGFQTGLETKPSKTYFNTFLGLSAKGASDNRSDILKCAILPKNLFPEEYEWLSQIKTDNLRDFLLRDINDDFQNMFIDFMTAYNGVGLKDNITFGEVIQLMDNFIAQYPSEKLDKKRHNILSNLFTRNLDDFFGVLPSEAQSRVDKIKQEIFTG